MQVVYCNLPCSYLLAILLWLARLHLRISLSFALLGVFLA